MDTEELRKLAEVRALVRSGAARSVRLAAGLSLGELAGVVGVSVPSVWRWEKGQRIPRGEKALRYGEVLDALMGPPR